MKYFPLVVASLTAFAIPTVASAGDREIGYPSGSLGYQALKTGNPAQAISQITSADGFDESDPARSINLAISYYRTGRTDEARALFDRIARAEKGVDLIVGGGRVMDSRKIAALALKKIASR